MLAAVVAWPPIWVLSEALAMAPKAAMPRALPIERANKLVPVTTPRCDQSTDDCAAIRVGAAVRPSPRPTTKQVAASCHTELSGEISQSITAPPTRITDP